MKNSLKVAVIILFASIAVPILAESYSSEHDAVKRIFQSSKEPTSKDAVWTQDDIFKVGVLNNGQDRSGYASYVCNVLYEHGFKGKGIWVQVIDIVKLTRENDWVKLGEARCA